MRPMDICFHIVADGNDLLLQSYYFCNVSLIP
jgi:hypothetical protein